MILSAGGRLGQELAVERAGDDAVGGLAELPQHVARSWIHFAVLARKRAVGRALKVDVHDLLVVDNRRQRQALRVVVVYPQQVQPNFARRAGVQQLSLGGLQGEWREGGGRVVQRRVFTLGEQIAVEADRIDATCHHAKPYPGWHIDKRAGNDLLLGRRQLALFRGAVREKIEVVYVRQHFWRPSVQPTCPPTSWSSPPRPVSNRHAVGVHVPVGRFAVCHVAVDGLGVGLLSATRGHDINGGILSCLLYLELGAG